MIERERELLWLRRVRDVCGLLAAETELERLLALIVDSALELADAERGFLVLLDAEAGARQFRVRAARGFGAADLTGAAGTFSRGVVERVVDSGREVLTSREEDSDLLGATSVRANRVRSVLGVPLRQAGRVRGALYVDAPDEGAFVEQDLPIVRTFADQATLALDAAEARARAAPDDEATLPRLVGRSPAMLELGRWLRRVASSDEVVLIAGESGTGKELVARELHALGPRPEAPFLAESSAAFTGELLESELFGHVRGAFTGATADRDGLFVAAGRGTVLLDEVADLDERVQARLLRVIQERAVRPVGGQTTRAIECRILASTRHDLRALVAQGRLREDLFYRLDVLRLNVPPLRDRPGDVPLLVQAFAARRGARLEVSPHALELLAAWHWPGNVRELENEVSRLVALGETRVSAQHLSPAIREGRGVSRATAAVPAGSTLEDAERAMVEEAIRTCGGNKARAARQLGIPRANLYRLLRRHGLE